MRTHVRLILSSVAATTIAHWCIGGSGEIITQWTVESQGVGADRIAGRLRPGPGQTRSLVEFRPNFYWITVEIGWIFTRQRRVRRC